MKRKLFLMVAIIFAAFFLVACEEISTPTVPVETSEPTEVTPQPSDPTVVQVDEAVQHVVNLISSLPEIIELANKEQVEAVVTAYNALSVMQQTEIINYFQLQQSIQIINALKAELDRAQANFNAIPSVIKLADKALVIQTRSIYDDLSNELKSLIINFNVLLAAEDEIQRLEAEIKSVENRINEITLPVDIDQIPIIRSARLAYDLLTEEQQQHVSNINHLNAAQLIVAEVEYQIVMVFLAIAELNDYISIGDKPFVLEARRVYDELTPIQQAQITNLHQLVKAEKDLELVIKQATDIVDLINKIPRPIKLSSKNLIMLLRSAYEDLAYDLKPLVTNINLLSFYEDNIDQLEAQAYSVRDLINTIPQPMILSAEDDVLMIKYAYDLLDQHQKLLVNNISLLTHSIDRIPRLIDEANQVETLINSLSFPAKVNERFQLENAQYRYNALHIDQKQLVTNASKLNTLNSQMSVLLLDIYDMEFLIMTITFPVTLGMKSQLTNIRNAFNKLSADQQLAVLNRNTLFNAELALFALESATPVITVAQARAKITGDDVAVEAVVSSNSLIGTSFRVFIEDNTAGIAVFVSSPTVQMQGQLAVGNRVLITGKMGVFNGQKQIIAPLSVEVIETGLTVAPTTVFYSTDLAQHEGKLISYQAILKVNNRTMVLIDQTGEVPAYFYNNADFTALLTGVPTGTIITIVAPLGYFNGLQFSLFDQASVTVGGLAPSMILNPIVIANLVLPQADDQVVANINLSAQPLFGRTIEWTSSNPAVIANDGTVTRPAAAANDESVTMSYEVKDGLVVIDSGSVNFTVLKQVAGGTPGASIYTTGFEAADGFTASTTYNNTSIRFDGPVGQQWGTYYGTASTTGPLSGLMSMQMRWYSTAPTNFGYTYTNFYTNNVGKIEFYASKTSTILLRVEISTDGITWQYSEDFAITTASTKYTYNIHSSLQNTPIMVRFMIRFDTTPSSGSRLTIDDIEFFSS